MSAIPVFTPVSASHLEAYTAAMRASLDDKLFFLARHRPKVLVDFGCADGALLRRVAELSPGTVLVGYDLDELALARARRAAPRAHFFSDEEALVSFLGALPENMPATLLASSVLHEVYAYGGVAAGEAFWRLLDSGVIAHFVLRDMALTDRDMAACDTGLSEALHRAADRAGLSTALSEVENLWGSTVSRPALVQFLLKYRYQENWSRELSENYLPLSSDEIVARVSRHFDIELHSHATLPFLDARARDDLGLSFPCPTHLKLIAHRR